MDSMYWEEWDYDEAIDLNNILNDWLLEDDTKNYVWKNSKLIDEIIYIKSPEWKKEALSAMKSMNVGDINSIL